MKKNPTSSVFPSELHYVVFASQMFDATHYVV